MNQTDTYIDHHYLIRMRLSTLSSNETVNRPNRFFKSLISINSTTPPDSLINTNYLKLSLNARDLKNFEGGYSLNL